MDIQAKDINEFRQRLGFNDPLVVQYGRFIGGAVRGDFGESLRYKQDALGLVLERLPATLALAGAALALTCLPRHPRRRALGGAPRLALGLRRHGRRRAGPGHPRLLARPHADLPLLGAPRLAAHRRHGRLAPLRHAVRRARVVLRGAHGAPHPLLRARDARRGVRPHRARQGPGRVGGHRQARAQELGDPHRHAGRARDGSAPRRRRHHRDHLRLARGRPAHRAGAPEPRLPGGARRGVPDLRHLHAHQPRGGPALRLARPADPPRGGAAHDRATRAPRARRPRPLPASAGRGRRPRRAAARAPRPGQERLRGEPQAAGHARPPARHRPARPRPLLARALRRPHRALHRASARCC